MDCFVDVVGVCGVVDVVEDCLFVGDCFVVVLWVEVVVECEYVGI